MPSNSSLYEKLQAFALDDQTATLKFSDRLARENGWSAAFAKAAIMEYKKFIYLAATSPTPVTPSDIVDQVWHLHLTYSRSYWQAMCSDILGKPLHHGPTAGGDAEDAKYHDLYAATIEAYCREFGAKPPVAFWPAHEERFDGAFHQRWVDVRKNLVLPHRSIMRFAAIATGAIGLSITSAALAAGKAGSATPLLPVVLVGVAVLAVIGLAAAAGGKYRARGDSGTRGDGGSGVFVPGSNDGNHGHGHHGGSHGGHDGGGGHAGCSGGGSGCSGGGCSSS